MPVAWYAKPTFLRKLTASCSFATAWYCVFHVDYAQEAGREHCFTWIQSYYQREVVTPISAAAGWAGAKIKALREP